MDDSGASYAGASACEGPAGRPFPGWAPRSGQFKEVRWPTQEEIDNTAPEEAKSIIGGTQVLLATSSDGQRSWITGKRCGECAKERGLCDRQYPCNTCLSSGRTCAYAFIARAWVTLGRKSLPQKHTRERDPDPPAPQPDQLPEEAYTFTQSGRMSKRRCYNSFYPVFISDEVIENGVGRPMKSVSKKPAQRPTTSKAAKSTATGKLDKWKQLSAKAKKYCLKKASPERREKFLTARQNLERSKHKITPRGSRSTPTTHDPASSGTHNQLEKMLVAESSLTQASSKESSLKLPVPVHSPSLRANRVVNDLPQDSDCNYQRKWVQTQSSSSPAVSTHTSESIKPPIWFSDIESFRLLYPEHQGKNQLLGFNRGFLDILVLSDGTLYHDGTKHVLNDDSLIINISRTLRTVRNSSFKSPRKKGKKDREPGADQQFSNTPRQGFNSNNNTLQPYEPIQVEQSVPSTEAPRDSQQCENLSEPFDIDALRLAQQEKLNVGVFVEANCHFLPFKLHDEIGIAFLDYFQIESIEEFDRTATVYSHSVISCKQWRIHLKKIVASFTGPTAWWTDLTSIPDRFSQQLSVPLVTHGDGLYGAWHCTECGNVNKRIELSRWSCSSPSCNNPGPVREPLGVDDVQPRHVGTAVEIDQQPQLNVVLHHTQYGDVARVTRYTNHQNKTDITKVHMMDSEQLAWAEVAFITLQREANFILTSAPKKLNDTRFDLHIRSDDLECDACPRDQWIKAVQSFMMDGISTYFPTSTSPQEHSFHSFTTFGGFVWSGRGSTSLSNLLMSMHRDIKSLIILVLGSTIDLVCHTRGSKRNKGSASPKKRPMDPKDQTMLDTGLHCNFSLSHGSLLYMNCGENVELEITREGFTMVLFGHTRRHPPTMGPQENPDYSVMDSAI